MGKDEFTVDRVCRNFKCKEYRDSPSGCCIYSPDTSCDDGSCVCHYSAWSEYVCPFKVLNEEPTIRFAHPERWKELEDINEPKIIKREYECFKISEVVTGYSPPTPSAEVFSTREAGRLGTAKSRVRYKKLGPAQVGTVAENNPCNVKKTTKLLSNLSC